MSDELTTALRELAEANQASPPLPAAEVRTRARRRSRRRRTTVRLGLATSAAGVLATIGLTVHAEEPGHDPRASAGSAATSSPRAAEAVTGRPSDTEEAVLDLGRHTLTFDGRVMRVDSHFSGTLPPPGRELTVRAKHEVVLLRSDERAENRYEAKVPYVVELRTGDRPPVYAGALAFDPRSLDALGTRTGWLGLSVNDARWFYTRVRQGEHVEIASGVTPAPPAPAPGPAGGPEPEPEPGTATFRPRS